jgi:TctA family transporter
VREFGGKMLGILWAIVVILFIFWLLGFLFHVGGALIHIILVVVLILVIFNLLTGRGLRV